MFKAIFFYSEVAGYLIPVLKEICSQTQGEIVVIHWDKNNLKPYPIPTVPGVEFIKRSTQTLSSLKSICERIRPNICYVSGWMDSEYLRVCRFLRRTQRTPIVVGFDDIWTGSLRQRVGSLLFPMLFGGCYSHAWVAGPYQYEFARNLGFSNSQIIFDLLSANTAVFNSSMASPNPKAKRFLYVGNFRSVKGTRVLIEAFRHYRELLNGTWELTCVGNGELLEFLQGQPYVNVHGFANESQLISIAGESSVLILPSLKDQWGVVVHEFASMGFPLLLSEGVGAKSTFLIDGYNGWMYRHNSPIELAKLMKRFEESPSQTLLDMGNNSIELSKRVSIRTATANFLSVCR